MYEDYFGLSKKPFSIVPDPRFFYQSNGHREALAHLLYGLNNEGGFVLLTGDVGTGKTTVCRRLLEHLPENLEVAFILNPKLTVEELLAAICSEFGITIPQGQITNWQMVSLINDYLLNLHSQGRRAVLILEEAQNLASEVLEQIRLLTNLETKEYKLLQVIMIGQPELIQTLAESRFIQLSQRITARYHLGPLSREEVAQYVHYRLSVAGKDSHRLFPSSTLNRLFRLSGGVPRIINVICDRALLGAFVQGKDQIDSKTLIKAAQEVSGRTNLRKPLSSMGAFAFLGFLLIITIGLAYFLLRPTFFTHITQFPVPSAVQAKKAEAEKILPPKVTLTLPEGVSGKATHGQALETLFKLWGGAYTSGDSCRQAQNQGLRCLEGKGSIISLHQMNKPAVLTLYEKDKGEYFATLVGLNKKGASLWLGQELRTVDSQELIRLWTGNYWLLWRSPQGFTQDLKPGSNGPAVVWLRKQLALARGEAAEPGLSQSYDQLLMDQVKKYQISIGLNPDGIVGARTILPLTALGDSQDPVLYKGKGDL
jgi:general secretion pathway protein A